MLKLNLTQETEYTISYTDLNTSHVKVKRRNKSDELYIGKEI